MKMTKRPKNGHFRCQIIFKYAKLMLIFQNKTILWTNKMDFQTFIFDHDKNQEKNRIKSKKIN